MFISEGNGNSNIMFKEDNKLYDGWTSYVVSHSVFVCIRDHSNNLYINRTFVTFIFVCLGSTVQWWSVAISIFIQVN